MKSNKPEQKRFSEIRKRAEENCKPIIMRPGVMSDKETLQLVHELQVHQIELEMQNEELRKSQSELEESRSKFSDLYDFAPVGYFTFDKNGLTLEANLTAARELGVERTFIINKPFRAYISADDRNIFDQHLRDVLTSETRKTSELRLKRKNRIEFYAQLESIAVSDSRGADVCRTSCIDISSRKQTDRALLVALAASVQRHAEISALLEGSQAIAKNHDFKGAAQALLYSCKQLIGATSGYIALVSEDGTENEVLFLDSGGLPCMVDKTLPMPIRELRGEVFREAKTIYNNDFSKSKWMRFIPEGHTTISNVLFTPMVVDGKVLGLLGLTNKPGGFTENDSRMATAFSGLTAIALTQKKAEEELKQLAEELKRSNEDLNRFASAAAHDLQEPLRGIEGFIKLLEKRYKGKLDEKADEYIDYVVDDVMRMQMLIKDLLLYSRVSAKGKVFSPANCSVVLEQALSNIRTALEESGAAVTYDPLPTVMGDEGQLISLFQNLIGNAIKFRSLEPLKIHVSAKREGNEWIVSVRDTGIGIDPKQAERIFVIFQRLHTRQEYPGTGIGLAICKRIVERHGGRIWVESEPGMGTTFYFTIPAKQGNLSNMQGEESIDKSPDS